MRIIQTFYEAVEPTCDTAVNIHRNPRDVYEDGTNIYSWALCAKNAKSTKFLV